MIDATLKDQLHQKLEEIDALIKKNYQQSGEIGALSGLAGLAIFEFYYANYKNLPESADAAEEIISMAFDQINEGYNLPTFCAGIAGMGWALQFLETQDFIEIDCDELLPDLDDFLIESMNIETQENFYDFLHGVLGMAFYFLQRNQHTSSDMLKQRYEQVINNTIQRLKETAVFDEDTAKWEAYLIRESKTRGYNLSLAHGIASIVNFLSRVARDEPFKAEATDLLQKAANYLLRFENAMDEGNCTFPDWVFLNGALQQSGRLAWCYGDIGIAISLRRAGEALGDESLSQKGLDILLASTKRRDPEDTKVVDVGICHGAAGLMHMYQHLYQQTSMVDFQQAADYWAQQTLEMAIHQDGYAGYMQKRGDEKKPWVAELNMLEGIAGIGLAIISYLSPEMSQWNEALLID